MICRLAAQRNRVVTLLSCARYGGTSIDDDARGGSGPSRRMLDQVGLPNGISMQKDRVNGRGGFGCLVACKEAG